ncbi:hypothetical protein JCM2811A_34860 [Methylorubrum rhodinum]
MLARQPREIARPQDRVLQVGRDHGEILGIEGGELEKLHCWLRAPEGADDGRIWGVGSDATGSRQPERLSSSPVQKRPATIAGLFRRRRCDVDFRRWAPP